MANTEIIKEIKSLATKVISGGGKSINIYCHAAIESELRQILDSIESELPSWSLFASETIEEKQSEYDSNVFESDIIIIAE